MNTLKNQKGSVLVYVLMAALALGGSAYYLTVLVSKGQTDSKTQRTQFELDMLAQDLKEYGKYLMFYEKIFYVNRALFFDHHLRDNWKNSFGVGNDACGYKGLDLTYQGTNKVNGEFVFCPIYLRNNLLASELLDEALFTPWKNKGLFQLEDGIYSLTLNLGDLKTDNNFTKFYVNEKGMLTDYDGISDAIIKIEFFSTASGVNLKNADRMFRISSEVKLKKNFISRLIKSSASETFLLKPSTPRGFSLFFIYPVKASDPTQDAVNFGEAVELNEKDQIFGKTYTNTQFTYTDPSKLPTFFDTLIVGKEFQELVPSDENILQMKQNFKNGVVVNFSVERFLLDQAGLINNASSLPVATTPNQNSNLMNNYISKLGTIATCQDSIEATPTFVIYPTALATDCPFFLINQQYISGGVKELTIKGPYSFVQSPVKRLNLNVGGATNIYGVIAGGAIRKTANGSARFYSLQTLRAGLTGIAETTGGGAIGKSELDEKNALATEGVTVPLLNIPNIYSSEMGFR